MLDQKKLVLASTSPFRKELLGRLGMPFLTASPLIDESPLAGERPDQTARRLSELKARAVAGDHPNALIIGSDQVAHLGEEIFGKPGDPTTAVKQLRRLSGNRARFVTGLCLLDSSTGEARTTVVVADVTFRHLGDAEIKRYVARERPFNCAGSAKSEGLGIALIERIDCADPTALIGLPLIALCSLLGEQGVSPL